MRHDRSGRRVHITAPGRQDPTPMRALAKGAHIVGVSLHDFQVGPPEHTCARTGTGRGDVEASEVIDLTGPDARPDPGASAAAGSAASAPADAQTDRDEDDSAGYPDWFDPTLGPTDLLDAAFRAHPDRRFRTADLAALTGLTAGQVTSSLQRLVHDDDRYVVRVARGVYAFDQGRAADEDQRAAREAEQARRDEERARRAEAERAATTFTCVGTDPAGRAMLSGPDGNFWVAIPVEPGFFSLPGRTEQATAPTPPPPVPAAARTGTGGALANGNGRHHGTERSN